MTYALEEVGPWWPRREEGPDSGVGGRGSLLHYRGMSCGSPEWNHVLKHLNLPISGPGKGF